jgi:hypothetical protein
MADAAVSPSLDLVHRTATESTMEGILIAFAGLFALVILNVLALAFGAETREGFSA